ncbi:hypothetical protein [Streptomyces malaysiensis]|uniref:Uncharacterized protein n=1 Tax=Streptomyces autolyticus TaxID=75293 RepID=A0ABN4WEJ0_9ACTN|nr:hypothetical protein [Streptomyces autolyticus]AQA15732.1 hypothetical protein BV401_40330 [Streptomyces autolyticus]
MSDGTAPPLALMRDHMRPDKPYTRDVCTTRQPYVTQGDTRQTGYRRIQAPDVWPDSNGPMPLWSRPQQL